jgi:hypothetical protein
MTTLEEGMDGHVLPSSVTLPWPVAAAPETPNNNATAFNDNNVERGHSSPFLFFYMEQPNVCVGTLHSLHSEKSSQTRDSSSKNRRGDSRNFSEYHRDIKEI